MAAQNTLQDEASLSLSPCDTFAAVHNALCSGNPRQKHADEDHTCTLGSICRMPHVAHLLALAA